MAVTPLTGPFIQAKGYSLGRNNGAVKYIVLHSAEGATSAAALGNYFHGTTAGSSNCGIGQDGEYAEYVTYNNTPWTNPPVNSVSDTLELCGFAHWTRDEWLAHPKMLETAAHWVAWRCAVRQIPIRLITGEQAVAGLTGVLDHKRVNDGFHKSTHSDTGPGFPWDTVLARAHAIALPAPAGDRVLRLTNPTMVGTDVANVQNALNAWHTQMGYGLLPRDGDYGPRTRDCVVRFQNAKAVDDESGVCGPPTWAALRAVVHGTS